MHIAHSAFRDQHRQKKKNLSARYKGYQAACQKHADTIAEIQRYLPGWTPLFSEQFSVDSWQIATI